MSRAVASVVGLLGLLMAASRRSPSATRLGASSPPRQHTPLGGVRDRGPHGVVGALTVGTPAGLAVGAARLLVRASDVALEDQGVPPPRAEGDRQLEPTLR